MNTEKTAVKGELEQTNGGSSGISKYLTVINEYTSCFMQQCISIVYALYMRFTMFDTVILFLKYVATGFYMYNVIKSIYVTSRERLKQKQLKFDEIQVQIQIVNTKLSARDTEFNDRKELLRRETEWLKRVRERISDTIGADESLRRTLDTAADVISSLNIHVKSSSEEDKDDILIELLKIFDQYAPTDKNIGKTDCGELGDSNSKDFPNNIYSNDIDLHHDCRVKIFKVTNVYKVAYLKHFIKQKRLRRANKQAALKKKSENLKKLMEGWQKALNMVVNSKLATILNIDAHPIDAASQEAMGDYSKPRESSDSDSDMRNNDMFYDECIIWSQNPNRSYATYNYEDLQDMAGSREYYEPQDNGDSKYLQQVQHGTGPKCSKMLSIIEETGSQIATEELSRDPDEGDCRDLFAI